MQPGYLQAFGVSRISPAGAVAKPCPTGGRHGANASASLRVSPLGIESLVHDPFGEGPLPGDWWRAARTKVRDVMHVSWAVASDTGLQRTSNEDNYCGRPDLGLFVVADGMGGHVAGEVASHLAVQGIEAFVEETAKALKDDAPPVPFDITLSLDANQLKNAFRIANRWLADKMVSAPDLHGMATTASAVLIDGCTAAVAHVGDSRVYVLRDRRLERLTRDHSWVEEQVRKGALSATAARHHPWRNVVTRALSGGDDPDVDVTDLTLVGSDRLLLCSDGLFSVLADERIGELVGQAWALQAVCDGLITAANAAGGPDNVTALVLQIDAR